MARKPDPTLREMAANFNVKEVTVHEHLTALERKGAIKRTRHRSRAVEVLVNPEEVLPQKGPMVFDIGEIKLIERKSGLGVADLREVLGDQIVALRSNGTTLASDIVRNGDYVLVEPNREICEGDAVLVTISDGKLAIRRYTKQSDKVKLQSLLNPDVVDYVNEAEFHGVFRGIIKDPSS